MQPGDYVTYKRNGKRGVVLSAFINPTGRRGCCVALLEDGSIRYYLAGSLTVEESRHGPLLRDYA